ncbi:Na+/H+ antiporter NhaA [Pseudomonas sp. ABC1]|uniref:Na+/H+ antiporter NhaA n=1 Tax=Pseudomonas sp. ABC1 TaxID=2748080 RepID=UPI0015C3B73E|nr:Na+/H+ antiporter NhaA [Pseudomonas sp. ABC1]QLF94409.1 Na+/H+ antiporter NhaA [Pseudomonas sp. ABC1]
MNQPQARQPLPRAQFYTERALFALERFFHIEAVSGIVLILAAIAALLWANVPTESNYYAFWHTPLSIGLGDRLYSQSLHFWINDALMTVFFLVVGMEIRREIHEGALATLKLAALPMAAALGGIAVPAMIYLALNHEPSLNHGWAVPTATDIAFAVGVLALLGRSIPGNVRIFLLALAIIDDIAAVLIIAFFYSGGLDYTGLLIAALGIMMVLCLQRAGIGSAYAYVIPGAILWLGVLQTGAHPTLAGVVLGLMTPVLPGRLHDKPLTLASDAIATIARHATQATSHPDDLVTPLRQLRRAQRELLAPVTRIQMALHPWVAYGVMPLFALANAGVSLKGADLSSSAPLSVMLGVTLALVLGKPLGILTTSWLMVRLGWCRLPQGVDWAGITLIGLLAGIGFTMSIFIATLGFDNEDLLSAAKLGVLMASLLATLGGLCWGLFYIKRNAHYAKEPHS